MKTMFLGRFAASFCVLQLGQAFRQQGTYFQRHIGTNNQINELRRKRWPIRGRLTSSMSAETALYTLQTFSAASITSDINPLSVVVLYGSGVLASLSPCAMSMLPFTIAYLSSESREGKKYEDGGTLVLLSLLYAAGLAGMLAVLGLVATLAGQVWGSLFASSRILPLGAAAFATWSGLSLLGFVELYIPSVDPDGFTPSTPAASTFIRGSRALAFGATSALVSSPCSSPVLASLLGFVASSGDTVLGLFLLASFTAGYVTPVVAAGTFGATATSNAAMKADGIGDVSSQVLASFLIAYGVYSGLDAAFQL